MGLMRVLVVMLILRAIISRQKIFLRWGAVDTLLRIDPFVSKGPAYDGRVKPEMVAYSSLGSSSAAAITTGATALLQQAYQGMYTGEMPSAELLKAVLLNTAEDVGPAQVDYLSGYGNLQAHKALETIQQQQFLQGEIQQDQERTFILNVPANARNLKITLVWHDAPAPVNSNKALVNDLDLSLLHSASGGKWLPWVLNSYPHPDSLALPATRGGRSS